MPKSQPPELKKFMDRKISGALLPGVCAAFQISQFLARHVMGGVSEVAKAWKGRGRRGGLDERYLWRKADSLTGAFLTAARTTYQTCNPGFLLTIRILCLQ
mmetsp:Transcript_36146/g.90813  ORF Transcript_36146/g.90813 Transcript_36146/m.90813 type:complete len:101 (-) Transcript_36146:370-672(-)